MRAARRSRAGRGFTLIEVLVVLLIMGIMLGLASVIAAPGERDRVQLEAERLAELLTVASEQARYTGESVAWIADAGGYRFLRLRPEVGWVEIRDVDALRPRLLPPGIALAGLRVENLPRPAMRLEFPPYGAPLSFAIALASGNERALVSGTPLGEVSALPPDRIDAAASLH